MKLSHAVRAKLSKLKIEIVEATDKGGSKAIRGTQEKLKILERMSEDDTSKVAFIFLGRGKADPIDDLNAAAEKNGLPVHMLQITEGEPETPTGPFIHLAPRLRIATLYDVPIKKALQLIGDMNVLPQAINIIDKNARIEPQIEEKQNRRQFHI